MSKPMKKVKRWIFGKKLKLYAVADRSLCFSEKKKRFRGFAYPFIFQSKKWALDEAFGDKDKVYRCEITLLPLPSTSKTKRKK